MGGVDEDQVERLGSVFAKGCGDHFGQVLPFFRRRDVDLMCRRRITQLFLCGLESVRVAASDDDIDTFETRSFAVSRPMPWVPPTMIALLFLISGILSVVLEFRGEMSFRVAIGLLFVFFVLLLCCFSSDIFLLYICISNLSTDYSIVFAA